MRVDGFGAYFIATRVQAGCTGIQIQVETTDFFLFSKRPDRLRGPPSPLFSGTMVLTGLKRQGSEVNLSPSFSTEDKNEWSCTSLPLYAFMVWTAKTLPLRHAYVRK